MANKISNFVFLVSLFLLQSCAGGKIGNFLESSFNNNPNIISQNDINEESKNDIIFKDKNFLEKKDKTGKKQLNYETKIENIDDPSSITTKDSSTKRNQNQNYETQIENISDASSLTIKDSSTTKNTNQNYEPKSYRIFVILKKVDPSFPTQNFSKVLRNGNINFEIEKIEIISELDQKTK